MDYKQYLKSDDYELVLIRAPKDMAISELNSMDFDNDAVATLGCEFTSNGHSYTIRQSSNDISAQYINLFPSDNTTYELGKAFTANYVINERFTTGQKADPKAALKSIPCAYDLSKLDGPLFK